ncbi:acyltransferase domain-containing protein, partial [Frankia sp. AgKG'84/4]
LTTIAEHATTQGIKTRHLTVSHAFHSPLTTPILNTFHTTAASLTYQPPTIPLISNLTGHLTTPEDLTTPDYWTRHIRHTVQYTTGITTLTSQHVTTYLELGPDTTLTTLTTQTLNPDSNPLVLPTLRPTQNPLTTLSTALATLHTHGHTPTHTTLTT